ncbi:MAG: hypothetical protein IJN53_05335 [Oscillospiraceae bacterium]|nr:hypothetical protein [Oscillospiraceae bacterium]
MNENQKLLSSILETAQMGQIGIRAAMKANMKPSLRVNLQKQLRQYDMFENSAHEIASTRCWEVHDIDPAAKFMAKATAKGKLSFGDVDSKIAAMMIQGNTRGMILACKNRNRCQKPDNQVFALADKMIEQSEQNVQDMQPFL